MAEAIRIVLSIPGSEVLSDIGTELSFRLPMHESASFPGILQQASVSRVDVC
jgi:hypothetical protein